MNVAIALRAGRLSDKIYIRASWQYLFRYGSVAHISVKNIVRLYLAVDNNYNVQAY